MPLESFAKVISQYHKEGATGLLTVTHENRVYTLYLEKGSINALSSSRPEDTLSQVIIASGMVSPWDVELAQEVASRKKDVALGDLLVKMGLLEEEAIIKSLNEKLEKNLYTLFQIRSLEYSFNPHTSKGFFQILPSKSTAQLLLEAARKTKDPIIIDQFLGNPQHYIGISPHARFLYQQAKLEDSEKKILQALRDSKTIEEILSSSAKGERAGKLQSLFTLAVAGFLDVQPTPIPRHSAAYSIREEGTPKRSQVVAKYQSIGQVSPEAFLELPESYTQEDVRYQYSRLSKLYHPDHARNELLMDLKEHLEAIFREIYHAYSLVRDHKTKTLTAEEKKKKLSETMMKLETAKTNFQYAQKMMVEGRWMEALNALKLAINNDPGNPHYLLRYAQLCQRIPGKIKEAERSYRKILDLDPFNIDTMMDLALLYQHAGLPKKARNMLKQAAHIDAQHPRLIFLTENLGKPRGVSTLLITAIALIAFIIGYLLGTH